MLRHTVPTINATHALYPKSFTQCLLRLVREPMVLARIEHALAMGGPPIVRGGVFELHFCFPGLP